MLSIGTLALQHTTPLLLRKFCKLFASVARVCQRQLGFLVSTTARLFISAWNECTYCTCDFTAVAGICLLKVNTECVKHDPYDIHCC